LQLPGGLEVVEGDGILSAVGRLVMPRMAGCVKGEAKEGRGEGKGVGVGQWRGRVEGGRSKTEVIGEWVKTMVNTSMVVANSVKLGDI